MSDIKNAEDFLQNQTTTNTFETNKQEQDHKQKESSLYTGPIPAPQQEAVQPVNENGPQLDPILREGRKRVKKNMPKKYIRDSYSSDTAKGILTSRRAFGINDSGEMDTIKQAIFDIEEILGSEEKAEENEIHNVDYTVESMSEVIQKYYTAIEACDHYLKDPRKNKKNRRYALVRDNYNKLKGEVLKLEKAKDMIEDKQVSGEGTTLRILMSEVEKLSPAKQISRAQQKRDEDGEFAKCKKKNPDLTREGFDIYKRFYDFAGFKEHEEYKREYEKAKDVFQRSGGEGSYEKDAVFIMRPVSFDNEGKPVEKDRENHEWNMRWLKAWDNDDVDAREEMIAKELPESIIKAELPQFSEEQLSDKTKLKSALDAWAENMLKSDASRDFYMLYKKKAAVNSMKSIHPGIKQFYEDNQELKAKDELFGSLAEYMIQYAQKKYRVYLGDNVFVPESRVAMALDIPANQALGSLPSSIQDKYKVYVNVKNAPDNKYTEYKKPEVSREIIDAKKAARAVEQAERAEEEKLLKQLEGNQEFQKLRKENRWVTAKRFFMSQKTGAYAAMLKNSRYQEMIKNAPNKALRKLSGGVLSCLSTVHFNEQGQVSEQDRVAHEKNLAWLNAVAMGNTEEIQNILAEQIKAVSDYFPYERHPDKSVDAFLKKYTEDPLTSVEKLNQLKGINALMKEYPAAAGKLPAEIRLKIEAISIAQSYILGELKAGVGLDLSGDQARFVRSYSPREKADVHTDIDKYVELHDSAYRQAEAEKRIAEKKAAAPDFNAEEERKEQKDSKAIFDAEYDATEKFLKDNHIVFGEKDLKDATKWETDRKKRFERGGDYIGKPVLTDGEVYQRMNALDKNAPDYRRRFFDLISDLKTQNDISLDAMIRLTLYKRMFELKEIQDEKDAKKNMREKRIEQVKANPFTADVEAKNVHQKSYQHYGQSCWAASGAVLVNNLNQKQMEKNPELHFEEIDDNYFVSQKDLDYDEEARIKSYAVQGEQVNNLNKRDEFLAVKKQINFARLNPSSAPGNLSAVADNILQATDNGCMVKTMQIQLQTEDALASVELLKDQFLRTVASVVNKNGGTPINVLNGGHFITIVGIKGRKLRYKDSNNKSNPDKTFDNLTVDQLFEANKSHGSGVQQKGGAVECLWLEPINEETMAEAKKEFDGIGDPNYKDRMIETREYYPQDYSHTKGTDYYKDIKPKDDPILAGLIRKRVYIPNGKPGEKVKFNKQIFAENFAEKQQAFESKKEEKEKPLELEALTTRLLEFDPDGIDMSTDEAIGKNFEKLEELSSLIKQFDEFMRKDAEETFDVSTYTRKPSFFDKLHEQKEDGSHLSKAESLMLKYDKLSAMSDLYRLKKMIFAEPVYTTAHRDAFTLETKNKDSAGMKRLKVKLRACHIAQTRLNRILGEKIPEGEPVGADEKEKNILGGLSDEAYTTDKSPNMTVEDNINRARARILSMDEYIRLLEEQDKQPLTEETRKEAAVTIRDIRRIFGKKSKVSDVVYPPVRSIKEKDQFAASFNKDVSESKRKSKMLNIKSRLYKKRDNAFRLEEALFLDYEKKKEYYDKLEAGEVDSFALLRDILAYDLKGLDLSDDASVVSSAPKMEDLMRRIHAFDEYDGKNNFIESFDESTKTKVRERLTKLRLVTGYYAVRKDIITDPLYSTHYNHELSVHLKFNSNAEEQDFAKKLMVANCYEEMLGSGTEYKFKGDKNDELYAVADSYYEEATQKKLLSDYAKASVNRQKNLKKDDLKKPVEMEKALSKKEKLDSMPNQTEEEKEAYIKQVKKYNKTRKEGFLTYIKNHGAHLNEKQLEYAELLTELDSLQELRKSGCRDDKTMDKMVTLVEKLRANGCLSQQEDILPDYIKREMGLSDMGQLRALIKEFDAMDAGIDVKDCIDDEEGYLFYKSRNDNAAPDDETAKYCFYKQTGVDSQDLNSKAAGTKFFDYFGMGKNIRNSRLYYSRDKKGRRHWGLKHQGRYSGNHTYMEKKLNILTENLQKYPDARLRLMFSPKAICSLSNMSILYAIMGIKEFTDVDVNIVSNSYDEEKEVLEGGKKKRKIIGTEERVDDVYITGLDDFFTDMSSGDLLKEPEEGRTLPAFDKISVPVLEKEFVDKVLSLKASDIPGITGYLLRENQLNALEKRLTYIQEKLRERVEEDAKLPADKKTILTRAEWEKPENRDRMEMLIQGQNEQMFPEIIGNMPEIEYASHKNIEKPRNEAEKEREEREAAYNEVYGIVSTAFHKADTMEKKLEILVNLNSTYSFFRQETSGTFNAYILSRLLETYCSDELLTAFVTKRTEALAALAGEVNKKLSDPGFSVPAEFAGNTEAADQKIAQNNAVRLKQEYALYLVYMENPNVIYDVQKYDSFIMNLGDTSFANNTMDQRYELPEINMREIQNKLYGGNKKISEQRNEGKKYIDMFGKFTFMKIDMKKFDEDYDAGGKQRLETFVEQMKLKKGV